MNQNKKFQILLIRPNSNYRRQDYEAMESSRVTSHVSSETQASFEPRTCLHHQISVRTDVTAILDTVIRLKLKTLHVSKYDFVYVFRWEEMRNCLHWWALQNKPATATASEYVLPTPPSFFHLKTEKISFSETLWGVLISAERQQPQHQEIL